MSNLLENLNKEQLESVIHKDGPLLIVAGAGTGKTTVITQRIAYMIEQGWAKPEEILALTFTEKAAAEMEERVERLLPIGYLDLWISTFHSFGERILREHCLDIGLPADFRLLNEFEQYLLFRNNLADFKLDYYKPLGNPTKFIRSLLGHFSRVKDEDIGPKDYLAYVKKQKEDFEKSPSSQEASIDSEATREEISRLSEIATAYGVYEKLLLDNSAFDFGDLINYTLKLFRRRPAILKKYRAQFKYILLDEFQDTNWSQYELIKILAAPHNNLTVCADDDQSIYRFRGASMSNVLQFTADYSDCQKTVLVQNYRNRQNILDLAYNFIKLNNPNRLEYQLNQNQDEGMKLNKKLLAQNSDTGVIEVLQGEKLSDEIEMVLEKIADLKIKDKKCLWSDFAILVRANDSAKEFINALDQAALPYQYLSSRGLYVKPLIMDIIAYFKLLDDYHESPAVFRVLNMPIFSFSYQEIVKFNHLARKKSCSLYELLKRADEFDFNLEIQNKINQVLKLIAKHSLLAQKRSSSEVLLAFLHDSGYLKYLSGQEESKSRENMALLNAFLNRIKRFETVSDHKEIKFFLQELTMEMEAGEEGALPFDADTGPEAIKILTVHAAKGLEYKYLFIVNLVDKRFPTVKKGEAIKVPDGLVKEQVPTGDTHLEEERRLFYVAVTRAKEHLYLTWAPDYGGVRPKKPSRFLYECGLVEVPQKIGFVKNKNLPDPKIPSPFSSEVKNELVTPNHLSFTQLNAFSNCPYQYYFAHVLKIPCLGKHQFSFGKTMHSVLQGIFSLIKNKQEHPPAGGKTEKIKLDFQEVKEIYERVWIDDWYNDKMEKEEYKKKGEEIIKIFLQKHQGNWPRATMLEKKFNFKVEVEQEFYTIRGAIDRIDEDDKGQLKLVDYKTGQPKEKLSFEEKEQLLLYQLAAEEIFRKPVGALSFYYLLNNSELEFTATPEELKKMLSKIKDSIKGIKSNDFSPRPGFLCSFCDFKDICEFKK